METGGGEITDTVTALYLVVINTAGGWRRGEAVHTLRAGRDSFLCTKHQMTLRHNKSFNKNWRLLDYSDNLLTVCVLRPDLKNN